MTPARIPRGPLMAELSVAAPRPTCAGCGRRFTPKRDFHAYCSSCIGDALRPCSTPGCGRPCVSPSGRCGVCQELIARDKFRRLWEREP